MALEMALLTPAFGLLMLFIAGAGRIVESQGQVDGAARDAARAASIQEDGSHVQGAVYQAASADLNPGKPMCPDGMKATWAGGPATGNVQATVRCTINLLVVPGFGQVTLTGNAAAPLDTFVRRFNW